MLKGFAYHGITVGNLDQSVSFYRDLLHMKLERTYEATGKALEEATGLPGARARVAVLSSTDRLGVHFFKLTQYLSPEGKSRFETRLCDCGASHLAMGIDEIHQVYEELRAKGVKFIHPPVHPNPARPGWFTYMLDPDGITVELGRVAYHHAHVVSDLDKFTAFYRDTLRMKLDYVRDIKGRPIAEGTGLPEVHLMSGHMVLDREEYVELHHYLHPEGKKRPDMRLCDVGCSHIAFEVDDVQQAYQEFGAKGARFVSQPVRQRIDNTEFTMVNMLDQDDYVVELRAAGAPV